MGKVLSYLKLLKRCNTLENELIIEKEFIKEKLYQHEKEILELTSEISKLRKRIKEQKEKKNDNN